MWKRRPTRRRRVQRKRSTFRHRAKRRIGRRFRRKAYHKIISIRLNNVAELQPKSGDVCEVVIKPGIIPGFIEMSKVFNQYRINAAYLQTWPSTAATAISAGTPATIKPIYPDVAYSFTQGYSREPSYSEVMNSATCRIFRHGYGKTRITPVVLVKDTVEAATTETTAWRPIAKRWWTTVSSNAHDHRCGNLTFIKHGDTSQYTDQPLKVSLKIYVSFKSLDVGTESSTSNDIYYINENKLVKHVKRPVHVTAVRG